MSSILSALQHAEVHQEGLATAPAVLERLAALDIQRRKEREKRKEDAESTANPQENVRVFLEGFARTQQTAQRELESLQPATSPAENTAVETTLDRLAAEMIHQEQRLAEASYFLPAYDLKSCRAAVQIFQASIESARGTLLPRKKFTFSRKVARVKAGSEATPADTRDTGTCATSITSSGATTTTVQGTAPHTAVATERDLQLVASGRGLAAARGQVLVRHIDPPGSDYVLMDCEDCVVFLLGHLGALRLLQLSNCTVVAGPVTGATFMDDLRACKLWLASYQVRIHRALDTHLYLRVRSRPIIEHSTGLRFASYHWSHQPTEALLHRHALAEDNGLHGQVDDFGWVKSVQSPNWSLMNDTDRDAPPLLPEQSATSAAGH